jgi:hypothetical protein
MAKQRLASMPLGALMKLRDRVGAMIDSRATALKKELRSLGEDYTEVGRIAIYGRRKKKKKNKKTRKRRTAAKSARTSRVKRAKQSAKKRKVRGSRRRAK